MADFDYQKSYENMSNQELLTILHKPQGYRDEVIEIIMQIVEKRNISAEEKASIHAQILAIEQKKKLEKDNVQYVKHIAQDAVEYVTTPTESFEPKKWYTIFLIVFGLFSLWYIKNTLQDLYNIYIDESLTFDMSARIQFLSIFFQLFLFYLLLKKKKWGWILFVGNIICSVIFSVIQIYSLFHLSEFLNIDVTYYIIENLFRIGFIIFFCTEKVRDIFNVDIKLRNKTILYSILIGIAAAIMIQFLT